MRHPAVVSLLALVAVACFAGCERYYTGGFGVLSSSQRDSVQQYRQQMAEREARLQGTTTDAPGGRAETARTAGAAGGPATRPAGYGPASSPAEAAERAYQVSFQAEPAESRSARPAGGTPAARQESGPTPRGGVPTSRIGLYGQLPAGNPHGRVSPMDGNGNLRRVSFTHEGADFDPDVDPSGRFVVYASTRHRTESDIYIKTVDGSAVTQLTSDPAADMMPTFSPDGKRIAFCSERAGNWDIYLMETRGGKAVKLTNSPAQEIHPSFSPDGRKLVYCSLSRASGQWELVVIDLENPATKQYIGHGLLPNWSPVDNRIVFQRARQRGTRWFSVWTLTYEDGEAHSPTELAASDNAACVTPGWSPDGSHVVFTTVIDPQYDDGHSRMYADVWVMQDNGANRVRVTHGLYTNLQPDWGPDGSIFFVSNRGGGGIENVYALRPEQAIRVANTRPTTPSGGRDTATAEVPSE